MDLLKVLTAMHWMWVLSYTAILFSIDLLFRHFRKSKSTYIYTQKDVAWAVLITLVFIPVMRLFHASQPTIEIVFPFGLAHLVECVVFSLWPQRKHPEQIA